MGLIFSVICSVLFCFERSMTWVLCSIFVLVVMLAAFFFAMYGITIGYHMAQKRMNARMEHKIAYTDIYRLRTTVKWEGDYVPPAKRMQEDLIGQIRRSRSKTQEHLYIDAAKQTNRFDRTTSSTLKAPVIDEEPSTPLSMLYPELFENDRYTIRPGTEM